MSTHIRSSIYLQEAQALSTQKASNARDFFQRKASQSEEQPQRGPPPPR